MKHPDIPISLNFKEINILMHALRMADETGMLSEYAKQSEVDRIRNKLQNVKG